MKGFFLSILILGFVSLFNPSSCSNIRAVHGTLVIHTDCKNGTSMAGYNARTADKQECLEYFFDGIGLLSLKHVNAAFNCCPGDLMAKIEVYGRTITISEKEREAGCHCMCLFDLGYSIENLKSGVYLIRILNQDKPETGPTLEVSVDLNANPSGRHCFDRSGYPWEERKQ